MNKKFNIPHSVIAACAGEIYSIPVQHYHSRLTLLGTGSLSERSESQI